MEQGSRSAEANVGAVNETELLTVNKIDQVISPGNELREKLSTPEVSGEAIAISPNPQPVTDDSAQILTASVSTAGLPTPVSGVVENNNPIIAEDNDLIEAEWVKRAKDIVSENKQDPYQQGESVAGLKVDYLKKRFGREIGKNN